MSVRQLNLISSLFLSLSLFSFLLIKNAAAISSFYKLSAPLVLFLIGFTFLIKSFKVRGTLYRSQSLTPYILFLLSIVSLGYFQGSYSYFYYSSFRSDLLFLFLVALVIYYSTRKLGGANYKFLGISLLLTLLIFEYLIFKNYTAGRLIFSDDHPSFLYRLQLLKREFPSVPFYNTQWNGGYLAREFFATGALNVFFLSLPFIYSKDISTLEGSAVYTDFVGFLFIILVPILIYSASRLAGASKRGSVFSGVLALAPSLSYFQWGLVYGTMGFIISLSLLPLVLVLAIRLSSFHPVPRWIEVLFLILFCFLTLLWPLSSITFIPLVLVVFYDFRLGIDIDRFKKIAFSVIVIAILSFPWVFSFLSEFDLFSFLSQSHLPGASNKTNPLELEKIKDSIFTVRGEIFKANPLIIFLGMVGFLFFKRGLTARILTLTTAYLFMVAFLGDELKPQLELIRMTLVAFMLLIIGAGESLSKMLDFKFNNLLAKRLFSPVCFSIVFASILTPILISLAVYQNRYSQTYRFATEETSGLVKAIKNLESDGRVFFSSFLLQELESSSYSAEDGGHVAPLVEFTKKPMYSFHYYHKLWHFVDPIPLSYRKRKREGIEEFLDLINATSVITFRKEWVDYFKKDRSRYQQVYKQGRFRLFTRKSPNQSYFINGKGGVYDLASKLVVKFSSETALLKFRYIDGLKVEGDSEVKIRPYPVFEEQTGKHQQEQVYFIEIYQPRQSLKERKVSISYQ